MPCVTPLDANSASGVSCDVLHLQQALFTCPRTITTHADKVSTTVGADAARCSWQQSRVGTPAAGVEAQLLMRTRVSTLPSWALAAVLNATMKRPFRLCRLQAAGGCDAGDAGWAVGLGAAGQPGGHACVSAGKSSQACHVIHSVSQCQLQQHDAAVSWRHWPRGALVMTSCPGWYVRMSFLCRQNG